MLVNGWHVDVASVPVAECEVCGQAIDVSGSEDCSFECCGRLMVRRVVREVACMACGSLADMDAGRDCVCVPCRAQLGDEFLVDGVAYAVFVTVRELLRDASRPSVAASVALDALACAGVDDDVIGEVMQMAQAVVGGCV